MPFESPDSYKDIGRIVNHENRPVPVCTTSFILAKAAEPVKMNYPSSQRWSISNLTASHNFGAICHSSINLGISPFNNKLGFKSAEVTFCYFSSGLALYKILFSYL